MSDRLPTIATDAYDASQREAAERFLAARGVPVFGPFEALMHSPELMSLASAMGEYLRYRSKIGTTLSELVILIIARHWGQDFEWHVHAPIAIQSGISPDTVQAICDGRRPEGLSADEALVYEVTTELLVTKRVSDASWARAEARFGRPGMVDLIGLSGYYTFLAMQLNASRYRPSNGATGLPRFPD